MTKIQRDNYLQSIVNNMRNSKFFVHKSMVWDDTIVIKKDMYSDYEYLLLKLQNDSSLIITTEIYTANSDVDRRVALATNIKIDDPNIDNLTQIAKLYFTHGRGSNENNPTLMELTKASSRTKSARTVNL